MCRLHNASTVKFTAYIYICLYQYICIHVKVYVIIACISLYLSWIKSFFGVNDSVLFELISEVRIPILFFQIQKGLSKQQSECCSLVLRIVDNPRSVQDTHICAQFFLTHWETRHTSHKSNGDVESTSAQWLCSTMLANSFILADQLNCCFFFKAPLWRIVTRI